MSTSSILPAAKTSPAASAEVRGSAGPVASVPSGVAVPRRVSRRSLFAGGGAALAAFWTTASRATAQSPPEVAADIDPGSLLAKLIRRTSMGITQVELDRAVTLGYGAYLEYQLNHQAIDDASVDAMIAPLTTLTMQPYQLFPLQTGQIVSELMQGLFVRAVFSNRQLFERMVEFWTDHFNIDITNELDQFYKTVDDREVVRANALGTFPAILSASAHSPAMLYYLNNDISVAGNPNENYARELMELHTMGVDGGYSQTDVVEVARCFTGWTIYGRNGTGTLAGTFRYNNAVHDNTQKIVLGNIIPAGGGMQDGLTVLNILAAHPSTARFISRKLCSRFLAEDPPQSVVDAVAATYTSTGGDIKAMLRTALAPNILADAALKYKRPFHIVTSALRTVPCTIASSTGLRSQLNAAGHQPFYWGPPDGYPDTFAHWSGLILPRWNFGSSSVANQVSGLTIDYATFYAGLTTADQMADRIRQAMFLGEMPTYDRNRIRDYLLPNTPSTNRQRDAIALAIASPSFQWY